MSMNTHKNILSVKKLIILILFVSSLLPSLEAQRGWEAGGWLGVSHYFGDLNTNKDLNNLGPALGAFGRYNFNNRVAFRLGANFGVVSADDADSQNTFERSRNLHFRSTIFDGVAQMEFNFLPYNHGSRQEFFTPYLLAGVAFYRYNPKAEYEGEWVELAPLGTEGQFRGEEYYTFKGGLAYGGGVKISLSYQWSIEFELSSRVLFSDYLDDVSTVYPDIDELENLRGDLAVALSDRSVELIPETLEVPIGTEGRQRGDSNNNDFYAMLGVSLVYYFGGINCPKVSY